MYQQLLSEIFPPYLMDLIYGVVSLVKDIKTADREFRNINFQLKYTLQKAQLLLKKQKDQENDSFIVQHLYHRITQAQSISQKLDELLNAQSIAIQDKIRLSLPFNQTKNQAVDAIENLQKAITDLKEHIEEEERDDKDNKGIKRKISTAETEKQQKNSIHLQPNNANQQQMEMGPTINDDPYHLSKEKEKPNYVQFNIQLKGAQEIIQILETDFPHLLTTTKTIKNNQDFDEIIVYSVARLNFQKCYGKIKNITKDIDRISTKGHFHIIAKKKKNEGGQKLKINNGRASSGHNKIQLLGSKKQVVKEEQEVFFSFPQDDRNQIFENIKILIRKQDKDKSVYRYQMGAWAKVEQQEIEIGNGEKLAAFINPTTKEPTIFFEVNYQATSIQNS